MKVETASQGMAGKQGVGQFEAGVVGAARKFWRWVRDGDAWTRTKCATNATRLP